MRDGGGGVVVDARVGVEMRCDVGGGEDVVIVFGKFVFEVCVDVFDCGEEGGDCCVVDG